MLKNIWYYFFLILLLLICFFYWKKNKINNCIFLSRFKSAVYSNKKYNKNLNYRLFVPETTKGKKYPLLLYLHPFGDNGNDNKKQVSNLGFDWTKKKIQSEFPCYILAPQCPAGTEWVDKGPMKAPFDHYFQDSYHETQVMKMIIEVIDQLTHTYPIDTRRIYTIGFSMGATGCWDILTRHPDVFAGAVISSGVSDTSKAQNLKKIPIWAFSGEFDKVAPAELNKNMVKAINLKGGHAKFTIIEDEGHNIGLRSFNDPAVKEWLFNQRKLLPETPH
jgi:predicted peptidase